MAQGRIVVIQPKSSQTISVNVPVLLGFFVEGALQFAIYAARKSNLQAPDLYVLKKYGDKLPFDDLVVKAVKIFGCAEQEKQLRSLLSRAAGKWRNALAFKELYEELLLMLRSPIKNCLEFLSDCIKERSDTVGPFGLEKDWILEQLSENEAPRFDQVVESAEIVFGWASEKRKCLEAILIRAGRTPRSSWPILRFQLYELRNASVKGSAPLASCTSDRSAMTGVSDFASDLATSSDSLSAAPSGARSLTTRLDDLARWIWDLTSPTQNDVQNFWYSAMLADEFSEIRACCLRNPNLSDAMKSICDRIERLGWSLTPAYKDAVIRYLQQPGTQLPDWNPDELVYNDEALEKTMLRGFAFYLEHLENLDHGVFEEVWSRIVSQNIRQLAALIHKGKQEEYVAKNSFIGRGTRLFYRVVKKSEEQSKGTEFVMAVTALWLKHWVEEVCVVIKDLSKWLAPANEHGLQVGLGFLGYRVDRRLLNPKEREAMAFVRRFYSLGVNISRTASRELVQSLLQHNYSCSFSDCSGIFIVQGFLKSQVATWVKHTILATWSGKKQKI